MSAFLSSLSPVLEEVKGGTTLDFIPSILLLSSPFYIHQGFPTGLLKVVLVYQPLLYETVLNIVGCLTFLLPTIKFQKCPQTL